MSELSVSSWLPVLSKWQQLQLIQRTLRLGRGVLGWGRALVARHQCLYDRFMITTVFRGRSAVAIRRRQRAALSPK